MDIRKMYCRVDSEHFEEFIGEIREEYSDKVADDIVRLSKTIGAIEVSLDGWMDECGWHESNGYTEFTGSWSIYSNTKPLSELTDSQAAELFNWWRKDPDSREAVGESEVDRVSSLTWFSDVVYRVTQKSELELFVELAAKVMFEAEGGNHQINDITLGALFDARFKAPKGDE